MRKLLLLSLCLLAGKALAAPPLRLVVLDVAEGQSVLLARGDRGLLIDSGHFGMAERVGDALAARGIRTLDYLILTHLHPDHASGYFQIRQSHPEALVVDSGHTDHFTPRLDSVRWVAEALRALPAGTRRIAARGDTIEWQGAQLEVLWPIAPRGEDLNGNSLVLRIRFGGKTALVMGDATRRVERALLELEHLAPVDILIAGHHGASDTGTPAFLRAVRPHQSVISVNRDNLRGYPDAELLERLRRLGSRVVTTAQAGDVSFSWHP